MAFEQGVTAASLTAQREALTLYQGDFLAQFAVGEALLFEEWVLFRRERLRGLALDALAGLAEASLTAADYARPHRSASPAGPRPLARSGPPRLDARPGGLRRPGRRPGPI
jgi:hypothetical protein